MVHAYNLFAVGCVVMHALPALLSSLRVPQLSTLPAGSTAVLVG
jgi:hypothetical protein